MATPSSVRPKRMQMKEAEKAKTAAGSRSLRAIPEVATLRRGCAAARAEASRVNVTLMVLVARAPADLLARCGEDPVRADGRRGRVACPRVGVDSEKAPQLIGRDTRVRFHLNEVETVKVEREV